MPEQRGETRQDGARSAHRIRLPGFVPDEPIGLGDAVKRATSAVGISPCGGCSERARRLNDWVSFSGRNG